MVNSTETIYPFYSYNPSCVAAIGFATILYVSLVTWLVQSLYVKFQPRSLSLFLCVVYLFTFVELILRAILSNDVRNTKVVYTVTSTFWNLPPRMLLLANYTFLVELRGKKSREVFDRVVHIIVPLGAITADIFLLIANELSFERNHFDLSFHLRQASAGLILSLAIFFYVVWYFSVPHARVLHVLLLLAVSSTCVLIQAIYVLTNSIPSLFIKLDQSEVYFYSGHLIPIVLASVTWSIFHPSRLLSTPQSAVPYDETGKEILPLSSKMYPHNEIYTSMVF
jgi:hypothetical protein